MLRAFRKKYIDKNVWIYLCNGCKRYGMMLHLETCVICGTKNQFYDDKCSVSDSVTNEVFMEVMKIAEVLGEPQMPPQNFIEQ